MALEDDPLGSLLSKICLRRGVSGDLFSVILIETLLLYAQEKLNMRALPWLKRDLREEPILRYIRWVEGLEGARLLGAPGPELLRTKKKLALLLELERKTRESRRELDIRASFRHRLHTLILTLYALRHLVDPSRSRVNYLPGFLVDLLNIFHVAPLRGKKWSSYSVHQTLKRAGGPTESDCVAVCVFSTEKALLPFRPRHKVEMLVDAKGHKKPRVCIIKGVLSTRAKGMLLYNPDTLLSIERGEDIRQSPERLFSPGRSRAQTCRRPQADWILAANGRAVFRGLPVRMGQRPKK